MNTTLTKVRFFPAVAAAAAILITACTFGKILRYGPSGIDDYKIFPYRALRASAQPYRLPTASESAMPASVDYGKTKGAPLEKTLQDNRTTAFLAFKDDKLIYEKYFNGSQKEGLSLSFSMAKSFLSLLIGCALDDGILRSVQQPVTDYVPELKKNGFDKVTIEHLLQMMSGMNYVESDNPFGKHPNFYYGDNLEERLLKLKVVQEPGKRFRYKSGENQLLGLILSRVLKPRTLTDYMQERIWGPLNMEYDGRWSMDKEPGGLEKTFCCIAARARDFAKIGLLYLHRGEWNGRRIVSQSWVDQSTKSDALAAGAMTYHYQWWLLTKEDSDYMAIGHLGQFLYVNPKFNVVILRLGTDRGALETADWKDLFRFVARKTIKTGPIAV